MVWVPWDLVFRQLWVPNWLNPDKAVIVFVGDGGFQMTNQELAILNGYGVPIKVVLINNHSLGMVRQWQESFYENTQDRISL